MSEVTPADVLLAGLSAKLEMHLTADKTALDQINENTKRIFDQLTEMSSKMDAAIQRVHVRIDANANDTIDAIDEVREFARSEAAAAKALAQTALDKIHTEKTALLVKILGFILSGGGIGALIGYKVKGG